MQENIFNAFAEQAKSLYAPLTKFNGVFVENIEKITELQLNALRTYAEFGIDQLKKAAEIRDAEDARAFTASQAEAASALNKKILDDAKAFSEIANSFKEQVENVVAETRTAATESTKTEAKPAAKKAS